MPLTITTAYRVTESIYQAIGTGFVAGFHMARIRFRLENGGYETIEGWEHATYATGDVSLLNEGGTFIQIQWNDPVPIHFPRLGIDAEKVKVQIIDGIIDTIDQLEISITDNPEDTFDDGNEPSTIATFPQPVFVLQT